MKKLKSFFASVFALTALACAPTLASAQQGLQLDLAPTSGLEFSIGTYQETYKEFDDSGNTFMQEKAMMTSVKVSNTARLSDVWKHRIGLEYAFGDSEYTGSYWGGTYGDLKEDGISRWRAEVDYTLLMTHPELWGMTLSGGLGYRVLQDNLQEVNGGYERTNMMWYAKLGAERRFNFENGWSLTPAVTYKHMLRGTQANSISTDLTQDKGKGYDLSLRLEKLDRLGGGFTASMFYRKWDIKASDSGYTTTGAPTAVYEPANKTDEVGVQVGYIF